MSCDKQVRKNAAKIPKQALTPDDISSFPTPLAIAKLNAGTFPVISRR